MHFSDKLYLRRHDESAKFTKLKELFEIAQDHMISVDLKVDSEVLRLKVSQLIREFKREHLTIWGSLKHSNHKKILRSAPDLPSFFSLLDTMILYTLYYLGLLFLYPLSSDALQVPFLSTYKFHQDTNYVKNRNFLIKLVYVMLRVILRNSKSLFRHMKARGVPVILWVLNEEEEYQEALEMYGDTVDGIMTDRPTRLIEFMTRVQI